MKRFFYNRSLREKFLLIFILGILVLFWGSHIVEGYGKLRREVKMVQSQLDFQEQWLEMEVAVKERLGEALKEMDPKATYTRSEFLGKIDTLARNTKAVYDINNPNTKSDDVFDEHSLVIQFRNAPMQELINFDNAVSGEAPYLDIRKVELAPNFRDPNFLRAKFEIVAIELKKFKDLNRNEEE